VERAAVEYFIFYLFIYFVEYFIIIIYLYYSYYLFILFISVSRSGGGSSGVFWAVGIFGRSISTTSAGAQFPEVLRTKL
jgi:hypothetical protein